MRKPIEGEKASFRAAAIRGDANSVRWFMTEHVPELDLKDTIMQLPFKAREFVVDLDRKVDKDPK